MILENLPVGFKSAPWLPLLEDGFIKLSGPGIENFLQNQVHSKMPCELSCHGAYCDPEGYVYLTFRLFHLKETYFLSLPQNQITFALNLLSKHGVTAEENQKIASLGFMLGRNTKGIPPYLMVENMGYHIVPIQGFADRVQIISSIDGIKNLMAELSIFEQATDLNLWKLADIQDKMAEIYPETRGQFTCEELDYPSNEIHSPKKSDSQLQSAMICLKRMPVRGEKIFYIKENKTLVGGYLIDFGLKGIHQYNLLILLQPSMEQEALWIGDQLNPQFITLC